MFSAPYTYLVAYQPLGKDVFWKLCNSLVEMVVDLASQRREEFLFLVTRIQEVNVPRANVNATLVYCPFSGTWDREFFYVSTGVEFFLCNQGLGPNSLL